MKNEKETIIIPKAAFMKLCREHTRAVNMIKILTMVCQVKEVSIVLPVTAYCKLLHIDPKAIEMAIQRGWIKQKMANNYQVLDAYDMALLAEKLGRRSRNRKINQIRKS